MTGDAGYPHVYYSVCAKWLVMQDYPHVYYSVCAKWLEMQTIYMYVILCVPND